MPHYKEKPICPITNPKQGPPVTNPFREKLNKLAYLEFLTENQSERKKVIDAINFFKKSTDKRFRIKRVQPQSEDFTVLRYQ